jgi:hypothetical protein
VECNSRRKIEELVGTNAGLIKEIVDESLLQEYSSDGRVCETIQEQRTLRIATG